MGYSPFYQAVPEGSELFRSLRTDRKMEALLCYLFPHGGHPLDIREDQDLIDDPEMLDHLVKRSRHFESRAEAEETLEVLSGIIDRTCQAHPGLIDRVAFIEKTLDLIEGRIKKRVDPDLLARTVQPEGWLFSSDSYFADPASHFDFNVFGIVSPSRVNAVSKILEGFEPDSLFDEDEDHLRDDLQSLKHLYQKASRRGEAIIIH